MIDVTLVCGSGPKAFYTWCQSSRARTRLSKSSRRLSAVLTPSTNSANLERVQARRVDPWIPPSAPPGGRVALFSQIKECSNIIESFVRHYAALGFQKLFLYLDDPNDVAYEVLKASGWIEAGFVEITPVDDSLRKAWPKMPSWDRVGPYANMEVQSRQILNNEHALMHAKELGMDWLLHADSDELLCLPNSAPEFFSNLSDRGCKMYTFNNCEGVPEVPDSTDVLRTVRIFRQNMGWVPRNPKAGVEFFSWQLRLGGWFISYENGKSAVNVKHAKKCLSVCMWHVYPQLEEGKGKTPDGSTCTWWTNCDLLWQAAVDRRKEGRLQEEEEVPRRDPCREAVLLHFCVCDFASFWRKRWTQLGYLSASDQFRVRATSGAMMSRFYRLQREGKQGEGRELYEKMCVCNDKRTVIRQVDAGVLLRANPERPGGASGITWPPSPCQVPYFELARSAETTGRLFDAWHLYGKALEHELAMGDSAPEICSQRAACALAAGMAGCALQDAQSAVAHGEAKAALQLSSALEGLGHLPEALCAAQQGLKLLDGDATGTKAEFKKRIKKLKANIADTPGADKLSTLRDLPLPQPAELQQFVMRAVRPDAKDSRLYRAVLPVAMGCWQDVGGDEKKFANALARAAIGARGELAALESCVKPRPVRQVRVAWDIHENELQQDGAMYMDLEPIDNFWPQVSLQCHRLLGDKECLTIPSCDMDEHPLMALHQIFSGIGAEIARAFELKEIRVLTELQISRPRHGAPAKLPEIDNGGLLPDNRREASFRVFVPADGREPGAPATVMLRTKDGEKDLSFNLQSSRLFVWWSRQTYFQVLGGEAYFSIAGWGVVLQKLDKQIGHMGCVR